MNILTDPELNEIAKKHWPRTTPTTGVRRMMRDAASLALSTAAGWVASVNVPLNTNSEFAATLTEEGARVYNTYYLQYPDHARPPEVEAGSTVRQELWQLMRIFGAHMYNGGPNMFDKNVITPTELR